MYIQSDEWGKIQEKVLVFVHLSKLIFSLLIEFGHSVSIQFCQWRLLKRTSENIQFASWYAEKYDSWFHSA